MTAFVKIAPAAGLAVLLAGTAVQADVTAQQVWDDWKENLALYGAEGYTVGSEVMEGDTLTISDLRITIVGPDSTVDGTIDSIAFTENGDGTVSVTMSESYPLTITSTPEFGPPTEVVIEIRQANMDMTVSGDETEMTYEVTADRYAIELTEVIEDGVSVPATMLLAMNSIDGFYTTRPGDLREMGYAFDAESVDVLIDATSTEDATTVLASGKVTGLSIEAAMSLPGDMDQIEPEEMFAAGLTVGGGYSYDAADYLFSVTEGGMTTSGTVSAQGGELSASMDKDFLTYDSIVNGMSMSVTTPDLPFPVEVSAARFGLGIVMPLSNVEEGSEFAASVNLTELDVNESIWDLFDPGAVLPRDPATVVLAISGTARLFFDILDPAQAEAMAMAPVPGEIHSISIDDLNVSVAGMSAVGSGAFTVDNEDMVTIPGFPRPEGEARIQVNGLNGLIDNLVQMGLIPAEEVMMPRMMLGMFATVTGDDQLESTLVINSQGHIIVNGQRMQ